MERFSARFRTFDVSRNEQYEQLVLFARRESSENLTRVATIQFGDLSQKVVVGSDVPLAIAAMIEAYIGVHCRH